MLPELFVALTKSDQYYKGVTGYLTGSTRSRISRTNLAKVHIPLPPLEVQREVVAEIETYQRVVDGARAVVDNWRPHVVVDPEWSVVQVGDCCAVKGGKRLPKGEQLSTVWTDYPYIRVSDFADQTIDFH